MNKGLRLVQHDTAEARRNGLSLVREDPILVWTQYQCGYSISVDPVLVWTQFKCGPNISMKPIFQYKY